MSTVYRTEDNLGGSCLQFHAQSTPNCLGSLACLSLPPLLPHLHSCFLCINLLSISLPICSPSSYHVLFLDVIVLGLGSHCITLAGFNVLVFLLNLWNTGITHVNHYALCVCSLYSTTIVCGCSFIVHGFLSPLCARENPEGLGPCCLVYL